MYSTSAIVTVDVVVGVASCRLPSIEMSHPPKPRSRKPRRFLHDKDEGRDCVAGLHSRRVRSFRDDEGRSRRLEMQESGAKHCHPLTSSHHRGLMCRSPEMCTFLVEPSQYLSVSLAKDKICARIVLSHHPERESLKSVCLPNQY